MEFTLIKKEPGMRAIGKMINSMAKVLNLGMKVLSMKEYTSWGRKKAKENTLGLMAQYMRVNGLIIELMEVESTYGRMEESIMVNGQTMTWKGMAFTFGAMAGDMKANIIMIRSQDMECTTGQMGGSMKDGGTKVNNMDLELILTL